MGLGGVGESNAKDEGTRLTILHIAREYPNRFQPKMTRAIANFVEANDGADHIVFSLFRTPNPMALFAPWKVSGDDQAPNRLVLVKPYWGLPFGLLTTLSMIIVAFGIRGQINRRALKPQIIHSHKLSYEGTICWLLKRWFGWPIVCSIRGEVEWKFFTYKPYQMPLFRRIVKGVARFYYVSAWFRGEMEERFAIPAKNGRLLPNFVDLNHIRPREDFRTNHFLSILHLDIFEKKGLDRLLPAFARLCERLPDAHLDVIGRGTEQSFIKVKDLIAHHGLEGRVTLRGWLKNDEVLNELGHYAAMVLPSHNETFGMSYVEALLSGVPVLYSRQTGIDGYINDVEAAVGVDPESVDAIAKGLAELADHQADHRMWLLTHQDMLRCRFAPDEHIQAYNEDVWSIVTEIAQDAHKGEIVPKSA
jgi:glycosyltransferase involved in cell wall biosynthesis